MCRNLSETLIRSIYLLVHRTLRTKMPGEIVTRIGKEFVNIDPMTWQTRERVNVKAGLSVQERAHKKRVMEQILAKQTELFQSGMDGVLVDMESYHNALNDWGRASLIDNPERYFIDPKSKKAEAAAQQKQQEQQAAQAKEKEMNEMIFGVANTSEDIYQEWIATEATDVALRERLHAKVAALGDIQWTLQQMVAEGLQELATGPGTQGIAAKNS